MNTDHAKIKSLIDGLKTQAEIDAASSAIKCFVDDLSRFPRPAEIDGVTMTPTELERLNDGYDSALDAAMILAAFALRENGI